MAYLVFCTFDLKNANATDYQNAYADLEVLGLKRIQLASNGNKVVIPTTSVMGEFNGSDVATVREDICKRIHAAFLNRGLKSEIFLIAADNWAWEGRTT